MRIPVSNDQFSNAMINAVHAHANPRYVTTAGAKILFNGFWRNGDSQNCCIWTDKATFHDAKTGDSGGCKEFANIAFNMSLSEFVNRFSNSYAPQLTKPKQIVRPEIMHDEHIDLDAIWNKLAKYPREDYATKWLEDIRGIDNPRDKIGSGFENIMHEQLVLFPERLAKFLASRIQQQQVLAAPIRSAATGRVSNLFLRTLDWPGETLDKEQKSRLLPGLGGWVDPDGSPRGFSMCHLYDAFDIIVICEGLADTLCAEALTHDSEKILIIGSPSAKTLPHWGDWLASRCNATLIFIFHLDSDKETGHLSPNGIGQQCATKAVHYYRSQDKRALLWPWHIFLPKLSSVGISNAEHIRDLGDVCKAALQNKITFSTIAKIFNQSIWEALRG